MFWWVSALFFVCLIAESVTSWIFIRGSKKKHSVLWRHAGSPTLLGNGDLISAWPLVRYVFQRRYASIGDMGAVSFADALRIPMVASYVAAMASVIAFFVIAYQEGYL